MNLLDIAQSYLSYNPADMAGVFIHRQFLALRALGWNIRVICPQPLLYRELKGIGRYYPRISSQDGVSIWRPRFLWFPRLMVNAGFALERSYASAVTRVIPEVTARWRPDLIVGDWLIPGGLSAAQVATQFEVPLVLRARGHDVPIIVRSSRSSRKYRMHYRQILGASARIICQGQGLYEELVRSSLYADLVDQRRIIAMTNGVDTTLFHPASAGERLRARDALGIPPDAQVWFYAGRWEKPKGSREFLVALKQLLPHFPNVYFISAGPIYDAEAWQELKGFSERIRFLGPTEPHGIAELLRASDVFVLPSYREGLPNSVLEAMASGLIVITTRVGGIPFVITDGLNGILIEARSAESLEKALVSCAENLAAHQHLGEAARQTIHERRYDLDSVAESVHQLFCSLVNLRNRRTMG